MKADLKALEGILDFLIKSKKPKKKMEEEVKVEDMDEMDDSEEMAEDEMEDMEEMDEEEDVRPLPGDNYKKGKGMTMSITQLGLKAKPKACIGKKKGKK